MVPTCSKPDCVTCAALEPLGLELSEGHTIIKGPAKLVVDYVSGLKPPPVNLEEGVTLTYPPAREHPWSRGRPISTVVNTVAIFTKGKEAIAIFPAIIRGRV